MGRPKNISNPQKLWKLFEEYATHIKANPIITEDWVGARAKKVERKKIIPLTMEGFENHCFDKGVIADLKDYFSNRDNRYLDFTPICARIKNRIRQDQIEGGMAGLYNPSITQRINSLAESTNNKTEESGTKTIRVVYDNGNNSKAEEAT